MPQPIFRLDRMIKLSLRPRHPKIFRNRGEIS